ncbi:hypothetical protein BO71DRAFT_439959 [Aspergillus ellipticus CBS 707.79]|uniref:Uncharacterized protein n=1 Tax=Aspergillus ellipticus CBS 707.79 TaxID=1448320 RepID=A0A319E5K6_9EURO|nr:hypothetical protein BO71DRAFT_439959 [Aspergillus ellipticus CBS 707.79]
MSPMDVVVMTPWGWDVNPDLEDMVAEALDKAGVPYCMWGGAVLRIYGSATTNIHFSGWVVPDRVLQQAVESLNDEGLDTCPFGSSCQSLSGHSVPLIVPDWHCHPDDDIAIESAPTPTLNVYKSSRLLWSLPDPPVGAPSVGDPDYMLASDPRIPEFKDPMSPWASRGRHDPDRYPIKIPTASKYAGSLIKLQCRDLAAPELGSWTSQVGCMCDIVNDVDENHVLRLEEIQEPFRHYMSYLSTELSMYDAPAISMGLLLAIRDELRASNELPPAEPSQFQKLLALTIRRLKNGVGKSLPYRPAESNGEPDGGSNGA